MAIIDVCDACGKRLDWKKYDMRNGHNTFSSIKFKKVSCYIVFKHYAVEEYDLCSDCYDRLMKVLLDEKQLIEDENS